MEKSHPWVEAIHRAPGENAVMWRYLGWGVFAVYVAWGFVATVLAAAGTGRVPGAVVLFAAGLGFLWLAWRREPPLLWLSCAIAVGVATHWYVSYAVTVLFLAVALAPFRLPTWQALTAAFVTTGAFIPVSVAVALPGGATGGIAAGLAWTVVFAAILHQLAVTRRQSGELAAARVLAERQRLAREIHDVLAHSLSAQAVHLEGTRLLLASGADPSVALDRVTQAGAMARAGLEETKRAVAALRGESTPVPDELARLADQFRATTGNPCAVEVSGDPSALPTEARLAVVRTAQEALTNVHKHAPHASVTVALRCGTDGCELDVRDTGGTPGALAGAGNGYGLVGMRERAELLGGELSAGPCDTGFRVLLRVPA